MNYSLILLEEITMDDRLMLFPELNEGEFDFDSMIGDGTYATMGGIPVNIDRIMRDVTKTTVLAISGTMVVKGVKIRGVWDVYGNIIACKSILLLFTPKSLLVNINSLFCGLPESIFQLVNVKKVNQ